MPVEDKTRIYRLADSLTVRFHHFAKGTYPCFSRTRFTVNRLILILENPHAENNYIEDAAERHVMRPGFFYLAPSFHDVTFHFDDAVRFFSIHFNLELFPGVDLFSGQKRIFEGTVPNAPIRAEHAFFCAQEAAAAVELHTLTFEIVSQCLEQMEENVARVLKLQKNQVNIKATTEEGLGFTGAMEGIAAQAVCALVPALDCIRDDRCGNPNPCGGCGGYSGEIIREG